MSIIVDDLDIIEYQNIVFKNEQIELSKPAMKRVAESYRFLVSFSEDKLIYGITTGFGPM
ncbi:MAG: aromatic amino acid lyase, partial [Bacteroidales bacterium]